MDKILNGYLKLVQETERSLMNSSTNFNITIAKANNQQLANMEKALLMKTVEDEDMDDEATNQSKTLQTVLNWWDIFVQERYPEKKCLEYFRCSRKTFIFLVTVMRPHIQPRAGIAVEKHSLNMIKGVSVEKQIGILLLKLAKCADYGYISSMLGVHRSTVHKAVYKTILALNKQLLRKHIYMPKGPEAERIAELFEEKCKIPQVLGVMQSLHIPVFAKQDLMPTFTNTVGYTSAIMQCVVDSNHLFRDLSIRHPGNAEQESVFQDSKIFHAFDRVIPKDTKIINGVQIPYKICTDSSYPLLSWILPSYIEATNESELIFNECVNEATNCVYEAFNRLRSRFNILSHGIDISYKITPQIIGACCIIHNICERNGDPLLPEWKNETLFEKFPQPEKMVELYEPDPDDSEQREVIRRYLETIVCLQEEDVTDQENIQ